MEERGSFGCTGQSKGREGDWHGKRHWPRCRFSGKARGAEVCSPGFALRSGDSPAEPGAAVFVPDSLKSSEAIEGSEYESTHSCPAFGAAGPPGVFYPGELRKQTFQKPVYRDYATDTLEDC